MPPRNLSQLPGPSSPSTGRRSGGGVWAVVPVKSFDGAKSRLESVLDMPARGELARRLMGNTVTALVESACFDHVLVVSRDDAALAYAAELGAEAVREEGPPGLNEALRGARELAQERGAGSLLVLFSDLPYVTAGDIRALVAAGEQCDIVIGPDRRDEGTNALLLRPPDAIDYAFGPGSFAKHLSAASAAGLEVTVVRRHGIAHDVDVPEDLEYLTAGAAPDAV